MKQRYYWLLALVSILTLMTTTTIAIAAEGTTSGHVEIGVSGMDTKDNPARVNEYVHTRSKNGLSFAPKVSLESVNEGSSLDFGADIMGPRDQKINLEFDARRILRLDFDYQVLEHWKDHDELKHLGATMRNDTAGNQPRVTTDATVGQLAGSTGIPEAAAHERYEQEMDNDLSLIHI